MREAVKVTFDKNIYEFVVDPDKEGSVTLQERSVFKSLHELIVQKKIAPFISEFILTYEVLPKKKRKQVLADYNRFLIAGDGTTLTIESNPSLHPGNHPKDNLYLPKAISMGFRILPGKRLGKIINPAIKKEWYYFLDEDYMETSERFSEIVQHIQNLGVGYRYYQQVTGMMDNPHLNPIENLKRYSGTDKKLSSAVSEWSDGDSVILHITYNLDYFCTLDHAKSAGNKSVFNPAIQTLLKEIFGFKKVTPAELLNVLQQPSIAF